MLNSVWNTICISFYTLCTILFHVSDHTVHDVYFYSILAVPMLRFFRLRFDLYLTTYLCEVLLQKRFLYIRTTLNTYMHEFIYFTPDGNYCYKHININTYSKLNKYNWNRLKVLDWTKTKSSQRTNCKFCLNYRMRYESSYGVDDCGRS